MKLTDKQLLNLHFMIEDFKDEHEGYYIRILLTKENEVHLHIKVYDFKEKKYKNLGSFKVVEFIDTWLYSINEKTKKYFYIGYR